MTGERVQLAGVADGYRFANKAQAQDAARDSLAQFPDDSPILSTATSWTRSLETSVTKGRLLSGTSGHYCEAFTARAAWDTLDGIELLKQKNLKRLIIPYWGLTQQFGSACFAQPESLS